jgi:hypothetical protein
MFRPAGAAEFVPIIRTYEMSNNNKVDTSQNVPIVIGKANYTRLPARQVLPN